MNLFYPREEHSARDRGTNGGGRGGLQPPGYRLRRLRTGAPERAGVGGAGETEVTGCWCLHRIPVLCVQVGPEEAIWVGEE